MPGYIRDRLDAAYGRHRGLDSGFDPELPTRELAAFALDKVICRARGTVRGLSGAFVGRSVRVAGRSQLTIGSSVSIGDGVLIDARSKNGIELGDAVTIDRAAIVRGSGTVRELGVGVSIGPRSAIGFANLIHGGGGVTIGADCLLGPHVTIMSEEHGFDAGEAIRQQSGVPAAVTIGDDVWLGAGVTVLAGVTIHSHTVVGAGAVVTHDIPANSIAVGVPARVVRSR